jgi:hypothetical protein
LLSWRGLNPRPARPRPTALQPPRSNGKPEAATAVVELLIMNMRMPETCWAVFKRQAINLSSCCIWLIDSVIILHVCRALLIESIQIQEPVKFSRLLSRRQMQQNKSIKVILYGSASIVDLDLLSFEISTSQSVTQTHLVGHLWTSDQPDAATYTW